MKNVNELTLKEFIDSGIIEKDTDIIVSERHKDGTIMMTDVDYSDYLDNKVINIKPMFSDICVTVESKNEGITVPIKETALKEIVKEDIINLGKPFKIKLVLSFKDQDIAFDFYDYIYAQFKNDFLIDNKFKITYIATSKKKNLIVDKINIVSKFNEETQNEENIYTCFIDMKNTKNLDIINQIIHRLVFENTMYNSIEEGRFSWFD